MHSGVNDTYLKLKRKLSKTNKLKKKPEIRERRPSGTNA